MSRTLVVGYGNTLRGDDAAGVRAAECLVAACPDLDCRMVHQLLPELALDISEHDRVIFLDASLRTEDVLVRPIPSPNPHAAERTQTHVVRPETLLSLSLALYGKCPEAILVSIPASCFGFKEDLSELTRGAVEKCVEMVKELLRKESVG